MTSKSESQAILMIAGRQKTEDRKQKLGFTLVELLVSISIVAILMALTAVALQGARTSARDGTRKTDLENIRSALEVYRSDCGTYPATLTFGGTLTGGEAACTGNTYMSRVPQDPISSRYSYSYSSTGSTYTLCAYLEGGSGSVTGCGSCGATCNYKAESP